MADTAFEVMPGVEGGEFGGLRAPLPDKARVSSDEDFEKLSPGTEFVDPEGKTRIKPYAVKSDSDYRNVPEGAQFVDPEGNTRRKPEFGPIGFTAQTLYDMAVTPSEKRKALERSYPGKVKQDDEGLYVDEDGKLRRPGRGAQAVGGLAASAAAPVVGTAIGALGGGAVGGPVGGGMGAVGGALAGQTINDVVLQLAGVYDRNITEQAATSGLAAGSGLLGFGVGRGVAAAVPAAKAGVSSVGQMLPAVAAKFLGAGPEIATARELAEKGVMVPPSAWAHEAPHVQNIVEVFDPAFRTNKPLLESATSHYETSAKKVLSDLGVEREGPVATPQQAVPTQAAGETVLRKTLTESAEADAKFQEALAKRKVELESGVPDVRAQREAVTRAAEESRNAAQRLIDNGFETIQREAEQARKLSGAGAGTGELWQSVGNKLTAMRRGIGERARYWYDRYDEMTGGATASSERLSATAQQMLDELPAEFKARNPALVQRLAQLAPKIDETTGEILSEGTPSLTYGQLHDLRSLFRGSADWHTLSSDFKNGSLKFFSREIDDLIHSPTAPANVQNAAKFLDMVDKWYGHNISVFEANQLRAVMKGLEAGEAADPKNLYNVLVREGHTDLTRRVRDMVGPNLWAGVRAADTDTMLAASRNLDGTIDGRKFAKEILDRQRGGMLELVHGKEGTQRLVDQALAIERLEGRLSIPVKPTDTMTEVIQRARLAADEAKALGTKDPLTALQRDVKRVQNEMQRERSVQRRQDPLGFLYNKSTGASYAVDKILGDEDLILAAAARFGEQSPEFNALRQVYVERVLTGTLRPGERMAKISPEVQNLMFPGVTRSQMDTLAKEMELLMKPRGMSGTTAGGMSAMSKVEHPATGRMLSKIPILSPATNAVGRKMFGDFFKLVTYLSTRPALLRWIEKGVTKGTSEEREAVRNILRAHLQRGGAMGAAGGEAVEQGAN